MTEAQTSEMIEVEGRLEAFGFADARADLVLIERPASWRMTRALLSLLVGWGLIPVVIFIPPHFPWVIGGFLGGIYFAHRFAKERYTLVSLHGACPRCGAEIRQEKRAPLKNQLTFHCSECGQQSFLRSGLRPDG